MQDQKAGIQTAIDDLGGPGAPPGDDAEQLPLLDDHQAADQGPNPGGVPAPSGKGRPPGSKNKRTEEWTEFLLARYTSPLEGLAEISVMSIEECKDLAIQLGCKALDIWGAGQQVGEERARAVSASKTADRDRCRQGWPGGSQSGGAGEPGAFHRFPGGRGRDPDPRCAT